MKLTNAFLVLMILLTSQFLKGQGFSPETQLQLQKVIEGFQNDPDTPFIGGISAAIKVDGLAAWQGVTGYAARNVDANNNLLPGGTLFTAQTLSQIYSVTKTFTAPLVLQLVKEGVFKLEDPVSKFLPLNAINFDLNSSVTIQQLLAHESGYSDYVDEIQLQIAVAFQPTHVWTPFEMIHFIHQLKPPGAERRYCSSNYIILGAIIEAATGKPVEQFFRQRFFKPLDLHSMYLGVREPQGNRGVLASPHDNISAFNPIFQFTGQPTFPDAYTNISRFPFTSIVSLAFTGGGIVSTANDLAEWSNALFNGRATHPDILNTMLKSISVTPDEDGDRLGYGIWISSRMSDKETFIGHDGSAPGYRSVMFYQPEKKLTLVVLTNFHGADIYAIARALYAAIPEFTCGNKNRKEDKIDVCFKGKNICIDRSAAEGFIQKGAYLGGCSQAVAKLQGSEAINEYGNTANRNMITGSPNPFANNVTLSFKASESGPVSVRIYDLNGKLVANVFNSIVKKETTQTINFNGSKLPAGIYISRIQTPSGSLEKRLVKRY
jgi:D-alanyl-D-alanine carboxypeptidase